MNMKYLVLKQNPSCTPSEDTSVKSLWYRLLVRLFMQQVLVTGLLQIGGDVLKIAKKMSIMYQI